MVFDQAMRFTFVIFVETLRMSSLKVGKSFNVNKIICLKTQNSNVSFNVNGDGLFVLK